MRITFDPVRDGVDALNAAANDFADAQRQVSTGKRIGVPSDDPVAAQRAVSDHAEVATLDAYTRSADSAHSRLAALDSVLGDMIDKLTQGMTAAASAQGSNVTQATRDSAASTLSGVRDSLVADINSTYNGSYTFGGSTSNVQPYQRDPMTGAWTYYGDSTAVTVDINRGRSITVTTDGQQILKGSDTSDVLSAIDQLITDINGSNPAGITAGIDALKRAFDRANLAQSRVGIDEQSVTDGTQRLATLRNAATAKLSSDEDANLAEAVTKMNQAETTYKAALGAVGTSSRISLMDYLT